ncbi:MAG: hypothetical protein WC373_14520, partial [Smithella sp.]
CVETDKIVYFELSSDSALDIPKLMWVLRSFILVGFNTIYYDSIIVWLACIGANTATLKAASDDIIKYGKRKEEIEEKYNFRCQEMNQIDLMPVAPLDGSLKLYAARLHTKRLQELPVNPDAYLTPEEAETIRMYNFNDLDCTQDLLMELCPQIRLREELGAIYDQDLRSKSDAQIAETVIRSELAKLTGHAIRRPKIEPGTSYKFNVPDYVRYESPALLRMLQLVREADFVVSEKGSIKMPPELGGGDFGDKKVKGKGYTIKIGNSVYKMGIGGLHSQEKNVSHKADENTIISDNDVASYYPRIILNQGFYAKQTGKAFSEVYEGLVNRRLEAKAAKNMVIADSLKITINGTFGKFGNKYSAIYSPDVMVSITLIGQISILMLIERIELAGIPVVSGNTDGVIVKCPVNRYDDLRKIISMWEIETRFETEETNYEAIYCRDVNNYIALKKDGKVKAKGVYSEKGSSGNTVLSKNPVNLICSDAVIAFLTENKPIEETILACKDIRRFVTVRKVKGGAEKDGVYLGKIVRFYYAKGETGTIKYVLSGSKVPNSEGAKSLMDLPETFPSDIDYTRYIKETDSILHEIAYYEPDRKAKQLTFF